MGSLGEEAAIIGAAAAMDPADWIFPCYREFGAALMRGLSLQRFMDNMFGNANDTAKGRQMPDHYSQREKQFVSISSPVGTQISEKHWHWGWTAGAGVEVKLSQDWSAKMEYLYVGLQDKSYFNPAPSAVFPSNQSVRVDDHVVRVGVNYKLPWSVLDTFFKR